MRSGLGCGAARIFRLRHGRISCRRSRLAASPPWRFWLAIWKRSVSTRRVEVDILEHALTSEQIRVYDAYAGAFQIIHRNLTAALEAANVTGSEGTLNARAKSAARSAFESNKQRFFNHLITAMKTPSLLKAISADLAEGHAAIVQLVSTAESLMERRLSEIPTEEWDDLSIDVTPREYVLSRARDKT
jgi:protein strawberry notch